MILEEKEFKTDSNVVMNFTGIPEEVEDAIVRYFDNFSPYGYQTRIVSDVTQDGIRVVKIIRWDNCN